MPRVSVGLPVYNGERYLRETLDSWLAQDEKDFEIIVSDNASSDATPQILAEYAARDPRIRVVRQDRNVGAYPNFNGLPKLARAPYFCWGAHDDPRAPSFLRRLADELDARPDAVLAYPRARYFGDPRRERRHPRDPNRPPGIEDGLLARIASIVRHSDAVLIYGLIRADALARTHLFIDPMGFNADIALSLELACLGPFAWVDEELMSFRLRDDSLSFDPSWARKGRVFDARAQQFVKELVVDDEARRACIEREIRLWIRKAQRPRRGPWKFGAFRSAYLRVARGWLDVSSRARGLR